MALTRLRFRHRICVCDRTDSEPRVYLTCPHAVGQDGQCFELIRRDEGVYGLCTVLPLPGGAPSRRARQADPAILPEPAAQLERFDAQMADSARLQPWPVPVISLELFDRLAARAEPNSILGDRGLVSHVCLAEEVGTGPVAHLVEVGLVHSISTWPLGDGWGLAHYQRCPGCERRGVAAGSYDGHLVRVHCPCGTRWQPTLAQDEADAVIDQIRRNTKTWFPGFHWRDDTALAEVKEHGTREGWFPQLAPQDEALLGAAILADGATTVLGQEAEAAAARELNRALALAEQINEEAGEHYRRERELARAR